MRKSVLKWQLGGVPRIPCFYRLFKPLKEIGGRENMKENHILEIKKE